MKNSAPTRLYIKLLGRSSTSTQKLYTGIDHLLLIDGQYREEIRRFYYKDIAAIIIRKTSLWSTANFVFGLLLLLMIIGIIASTDAQPFFIFMGVMLFLPFCYNLLRGPTINLAIKTVVQQETIGCASRRYKARKLIKFVMPLIKEAQQASNQIEPIGEGQSNDRDYMPEELIPPPTPIIPSRFAPPPLPGQAPIRDSDSHPDSTGIQN